MEKTGNAVKLLLKLILPLCLIAAGVAGFNYYKSREIKMKRRPRQKQIPLVETLSASPGRYQSSIQVMGTVVPDRQVILKSKLAGEVISISPDFVQGGLMKKGDTLLQLDDADYRIEVQKARSALDKVLSDLAIEKGNQQIAIEELELIKKAELGDLTATDLTLRKPQLTKANAAVNSARSDFDKAKLNLSRTRVEVPFNALVLEKNVDLGSVITQQGTIATLVDIDTYHVEALVPPDRLGSIIVDENTGSHAVIRSQYSSQSWQGKAIRLTGRINAKSRMAGVIISVTDPLGSKNKAASQPLLLNDFVEVRIMGNFTDNIYSLPRSVVHEGDTIWIYDSGVLKIRKVAVAWKEEARIFIQSGIEPGDQIITTDLPAPLEGMALQLAAGEKS